MKVFEFAKEVGVETIALMDKIRGWKLPVKSHMATLSDEQIEEIRAKLKEESGSSKKKVVKKAAKKKVAKKASNEEKGKAEKTSEKKSEKKIVKKATSIKKPTTVKKAVARKKADAADSDSEGGSKKTVIRRKASDIEAQALEDAANAAALLKEEAAVAGSELTEEGGSYSQESQENYSQEPDNTSGATEEVKVSPTTTEVTKIGSTTIVQRKNIVGRMDLSRVRPPAGRGPTGAPRPAARPQQGPTSSSGGGYSGSPSNLNMRTGAGRSIRTGFVGPAPMVSVDDAAEREREREREEKKKKAGAGRDQVVQTFTAADFRKREVIFQPKKKRVLTGANKQTEITQPKASKRVVKMHDSITVADLAQQINVKAPQLIKKLMSEGVMANMNTPLDFDTVSLIVGEFNYDVQSVAIDEGTLLANAAFGNLDAAPIIRPPVVTVMGHVDHGKTTLLDAIRNADVASGEAGGITQHIGAYNVTLTDGQTTTFIDTPGHAAFTEMRARGANVTDIAIIVVAADDGMMPQTEEAISHAQAAGVPIIVAVNKMDKQGANPDRIKQQLAEKQLVPEEWGGETIFVPVSALKREGIKELLESVHLVAEVLELKANPERSGTGVVIESKMEKGKGNVATVLVQDGTIRVGEAFVAGTVTGRIRRMTNDKGEVIKIAGPGTPVEISGLDNSPGAGDKFDICKTDEQAREVADLREKLKVKEDVPSSKMSLDVIFSKVKAGDLKELNIVLKADVVGSLEAIQGMLAKLGNEEVKVKVVHSGVGGISENDVLLAATAGGLVIGFNVRPDTTAQRVAKERGVEIKNYSVIYNLTDDIKNALAGLLSPDLVEETLGSVEVRNTFSVPKLGVIAGGFVVDGKVIRNGLVRLVREGRVIYSGKIGSLKRFKDDAKEVQSGYECGVGIENYNDIKVGDVIEVYQTKEIARTLE